MRSLAAAPVAAAAAFLAMADPAEPASLGAASLYDGMCEASAAVSLDDSHFVVASDEMNTLRIYRRGDRALLDPAGNVTGLDKSDLEAGTRIGDVVYWLSSHSFNNDGKDKPKRKVFFATRFTPDGSGGFTLSREGSVVLSLRDAMPSSIKADAAKLNIEGLAATPDGRLLLGLRGPLQADGKAQVLVLNNPAAVIAGTESPEFELSAGLDLGGRGIRSLEYVGVGTVAYVVAAGPVDDNGTFALYSWKGPGDTAPIKILDFDPAMKLRPEALVAFPGQSLVQVLSDDGDGIDGSGPRCQDDDPTKDKHFRSVDVSLP